MNKLEQFIAVYEPQSDRNIGFRKMLDEIISEVKNKPVNEIIGMRDYFAAKAMQAIIGNSDQASLEVGEVDNWVGDYAYVVADAMMEAKERKR
jgi:hypothetical protein